MAKCINRENLVISIGTYKDRQSGQDKNQYRTIGELVTMQNDDGSAYQFGNMWGPTGSTKFNVYAQENRQNAVQSAARPTGDTQPQQRADEFGDEIPF